MLKSRKQDRSLVEKRLLLYSKSAYKRILSILPKTYHFNDL
nr:MAG TPA: hypothetical protein [Caudoviricetes sp.]